AENGVSFGRLVSSEGREHFVAETAPTLGASNAGPRVGPLVFSEILYHPPRSGTNDSDLSEFIEIRNVSNATVPLYDPIAPTNTWRVGGGVRFVFPPEQQLAAGGTLLLVNFDPALDTNALASFRVRYHPGATVPIFGPYGGVLNDDEDSLELTKPILLNGSNLAQVLIDAVNYADSAPWPELADGTGLSLQRRSPTAYGNDPANWFAGAPTAGAAPANGTAPTFLVQPQSMTVPAFSSLTLSVMAGGSSPLRYQWQRNGENLPGATNAMLQFSNVPPEAAGSYQVVVYNEAGSVASSNMTLTLILPPALLRAPVSVSLRGSTNAIDYGSTTNRSASFNVTAYSPSPLSYQWRFNGAPIPGAINPTLTVTNVTVTDDGWYDVVVSDPQGSVTSPPARLLVLLNPLIVVAPRDQAVVVGGSFTASLVVKGNPPPFYFQFRHTSSNLASFVSESGTNFFTRSNLQTNHGGLYRIIVTNAASPTATIAASFNVTILADADGDGLPDLWEQNFFGGLTNADPDADADGDGSLNWQEYIAGTDPTDPQSYLRLESLTPVGTVLTFEAVSNLTYAIEYTDGLAVGSRWLRLADIPARPSSGPVQVSDAHPHPTNRLYRLVTPRRPAAP
ncbi:MAG TPA: immunoglobulin domain-containing protein, partial [Verrucomicrobiae bacterium]|nr:immunoglobulin domain-containing protein [Verrucomicrobiae bacterium]